MSPPKPQRQLFSKPRRCNERKVTRNCPDCTARVILGLAGLAGLAAFMSTEVYGDGEKATTAHPVRTNHRRPRAC
jgi:hypothetical protein